jgi:hypothetical protein
MHNNGVKNPRKFTIGRFRLFSLRNMMLLEFGMTILIYRRWTSIRSCYYANG